MPGTTFKIFAPMLKTSLGPDGRMRLHGVASSTIRDRHGDEMALSALSDMERSAQQNMTIFLNHSYDVPEDVAGSVERASIHSSMQDPDIHDLSLDVLINHANERAVKAWEAINGGTKLGLSIGAMIPDGGATRLKNGSYRIDHVELLETSLVGVPANPRSWVEYAVKALNTGDADTSYNGNWTITVDQDLTDTVTSSTFKEQQFPEVEESDPGEDFQESLEPVEEPVEQSPEQEPPEGVLASIETEEEDEADYECEECGLDIGECKCDTPKRRRKATVSVETPHAKITVDTGNRGKTPENGSSQEAQASAPENEDEEEAEAPNPWAAIGLSGEAEAEVKAALDFEPTVIASLTTSTDLLKAITRELVDTKEALRAVEEERDAAVQMAEKAIRGTHDVLTRLSSTPVGRRAVVREAQAEMSGLVSVYGEEFVSLLKKG